MCKNFLELYVKVTKIAYALYGNQNDLEDIIQNVVIKIFEKNINLETLNSKWLYRTIRNCAVDYRKHQAVIEKYRDRMVLIDSAGTICDSGADGHEIYTPADETQSKVNELDTAIDCESLEKLSKPMHAVLELRLRGMIYKEIAEQLQISVGTVRSRLHYARKKNRGNRDKVS